MQIIYSGVSGIRESKNWNLDDPQERRKKWNLDKIPM